jgi:hypothetical protein
VVEFDPARSVATGARFLPFPNDLVRDPTTGKLNLSAQACESATSKATREGILNKLDGFGTYEAALVVTFTSEVDMASLEGNVVLYQITNQGTAIDPGAAVSVPLILRKTQSVRLLPDACTSPSLVNAVVAVPMVPLTQKSTYVAAVLKGVKDTTGAEFTGSYTWGLVNASEAPVTLDDAGNVVSERTPLSPADPEQLASLQALDLLWKAHAKALAFLDAVPNARPRTDNLVAFQFTTQTVTDQLDPSVTGSVASKLSVQGFFVDPSTANTVAKFAPLFGICNANGQLTTTDAEKAQCFLKLALGGCDPQGVGCDLGNALNNANYTAGAGACQLYGCAAIGNVFGGAIGTTNYQQQLANPWTNANKKSLQGAWTDPVNPESQGALILETLVTVPMGATPPDGWPVIIYGHGLTLSKETALTFAGRAAQAGFATVAIDFAGHGSRAIRTSDDVALGCTGRCVNGGTGEFYSPADTCETVADCPSPSADHCGRMELKGTDPAVATAVGAAPTPRNNPQCYDPFLSTDLAKTRDGLRQSVLDLERVVFALKACGNGCGPLTTDPARIFYTGVSLGGILGSIATANSPDIKAAMLSVPGAGWIDLLENTDTVEFRCPLINGLIDAGVLSGTKWNGTNADALCLAADKAAWQGQPGYATFATTGRWILDPADPANFMRKLAPKRFMIQEVTGDTVVPNIATDRMAALLGLTDKRKDADPIPNPAAATPSAAVVQPTPLETKYILYTNDSTAVYAHSSLIKPPDVPAAVGAGKAQAGTIRMHVDAATWLGANK